MRVLPYVISSLILAGCAAAPLAPVAAIPAPPEAPSPFVGSSGMVIGTLSYRYVEVADSAWVVHLSRIDAGAPDAGAAEDYALPVSIDTRRHQGVFAGALPAGVYAFRDAAVAGRHFPSGMVRMPFEVQAGEVRDAGHYAINPVAATE